MRKDNINNFPGYYVSPSGCVYSRWEWRPLNKPLGGRLCFLGENWRKLKPGKGKNGYLVVALKQSSRMVTKTLHSLVLRSYYGERPHGLVACHNNGIRTDCRLKNLRWDTRKANEADKLKHGTYYIRGKKVKSIS